MQSPSSPNQAPIRILTIDDHTMFLAGLRFLLSTQSDLKVVGEASNRFEAIAIAGREQPDIILLDLIISGDIAVDYIVELYKRAKGSRILILTSVQDSKVHQAAIQAGALGVVLKDKAPEDLFKAIRKVHAGEVWLDRMLMAEVVTGLSRQAREPKNDLEEARLRSVTKREREIIALICQGLKNRQIAERLSLSETTVRHHLTSIFSKLNINDRFELIIYSHTHRLCELRVWNSTEAI